MGTRATGGALAAPIFRDFMREALRDKPATPFRIPPGIELMPIDLEERAARRPRARPAPSWKPSSRATNRAGLPSDSTTGAALTVPTAALGIDGSRHAITTRRQRHRRASIDTLRPAAALAFTASSRPYISRDRWT